MHYMMKTCAAVAMAATFAGAAIAGDTDGTGNVTGTTPIVVVISTTPNVPANPGSPGSGVGGGSDQNANAGGTTIVRAPAQLVRAARTVSRGVATGRLPAPQAQAAIVNTIQTQLPAGPVALSVSPRQATALIRVVNSIEAKLGANTNPQLISLRTALRNGLGR